MNENVNPNDETAPVAPQPYAAEQPPKRGWRDRFRTSTPGESRGIGTGALVASTVAALLIGGLGGVLVGQETAEPDWDDGGWGGRMMQQGQTWQGGPMMQRRQGGQGYQMGPQGQYGPGGGFMDPDDCPFLDQDE